MGYKGTLIAVSDLEKSRRFYECVLDMPVVEDFGSNLQLNGVFLQSAESWLGFIGKNGEDLRFQNNVTELYFETEDMDGFVAKLQGMPDISYVHPLLEHSWGQRGIRFYDPDGHMIEVSEEIGSVARRFLEAGMTREQVAQRMDTSLAYVEGLLK